MTYIDTSFERCELKKCYTFLDQTKFECMLEHGCPEDIKCPLDKLLSLNTRSFENLHKFKHA